MGKINIPNLAYVLLGLFCIAAFLRLTGIIQMNEIVTPSMEPALETNSIVLLTNLKSPQKNAIVSFEVNPFLANNKQRMESKVSTYISRVVAIENDMLEIKEGILFVNGAEETSSFSTKHMYEISYEDYSKYQDKVNFELVMGIRHNTRPVQIFMDRKNKEALDDDINFELVENPITSNGLYKLGEKVKEGWTINNFGPFKVPVDHFFLMSDNRSNALDSRFFGSIAKSQIVGVKI